MADQQGAILKPSQVLVKTGVRLGMLGVLFLIEKVCLDTLVDYKRVQAAQGIGTMLRMAQHWGFRFLVVFLATAAILAIAGIRRRGKDQISSLQIPKIRTPWMLSHLLLFAALTPITYALYRDTATQLLFTVTVIAWVIVGACAVLAALFAVSPWAAWRKGIRSLGSVWLYAAFAALIGTSVWQQSEKLWDSTTAITFFLVKLVLNPLLPDLSADSATRIVSTDTFAVEITDVCSGLEGLGLMLAFSVAWLVYFRREYIFPRALVLVPLSLTAMFALNVLRIAALMLIGNAGFPDVAAYGFHSQAGWIAFNVVACALVLLSRRSRWLYRVDYSPSAVNGAHNPTAVYLMPFLAILAAGAVSHAMSGGFETLYPTRFIAAVTVIFIYRRSLARIEWRCSWRGVAVGILVFCVWLGAARSLLPASGMPDALVAMSSGTRALWVLGHFSASVLTVPVAEELAYRGFLMRRIGHLDFEATPYQSVHWSGLAVAAIAFGLAHGRMWLPGIGAGLAYGLIARGTGRLGEAVAAHATSNLIVAVWVVGGSQWQLWL